MLSFQCSLTCGKGVRTRAVKCVKDDSSRQEVAESQCPAGSKPEAMEACVTAVCSPEISRWPPEFAGCRYCLWLWEGSVAVGRECGCVSGKGVCLLSVAVGRECACCLWLWEGSVPAVICTLLSSVLCVCARGVCMCLWGEEREGSALD